MPMIHPDTATAPDYIFVGGVMRSGTSLVQKMLDLHPSIYGGPEMGMLTGLMAVYRDLRRNIASGKIAMVLSEETARASCRAFVQTVYREKAADRSYRYISEKTPDNLLVFSELAEVFPAAQFVWVIRDPRDVLVSMHAVARRAQAQGVSSTRPGWIHEVLRSMRQNIERGEAFRRSHGDRLRLVYYEDVLADARSAAESLCGFLGIEFDGAMLDTEVSNDTSRAIGTARQTRDVFYTKEMFDRPIDSSNTGKWESELDVRAVRAIEAHLGRASLPSLARYGIGGPGRLWTTYFSVAEPVSILARAISSRIK